MPCKRIGFSGSKLRSGGVIGRGQRENAASNSIVPRRFDFFTR